MITIEKLSKHFTSGDTTVKAVDNVSFRVPTGQMAAIIGKSGSGKSTLLALLGALDTPTSGTIELDGEMITKFGERDLLHYRQHDIGFVFQNYNLVPNLSAIDNVLLPMEFGKKPGNRRQRAEHLLHSVGLTGDKLKRRPGKLSGGEQQRVAIARALANKPKLILADEPTGNLDTQTSKTIVDLLKSLATTEEATVIVVTHDPGIASHAHTVFQMRDGKLSVE